MDRIASFTVDHDFVVPGIYISRIDGDITTFDLRTRKPNQGEYMDNVTMHTVEHMFATFVRNSDISKDVIYFGPMGCQTGFYLLTRNVDPEKVYITVMNVLENILAYEGPVFGASQKECGNYRNLDLAAAKVECSNYLNVLKNCNKSMEYPKGDKI